jgi:hypothetical protein
MSGMYIVHSIRYPAVYDVYPGTLSRSSRSFVKDEILERLVFHFSRAIVTLLFRHGICKNLLGFAHHNKIPSRISLFGPSDGTFCKASMSY